MSGFIGGGGAGGETITKSVFNDMILELAVVEGGSMVGYWSTINQDADDDSSGTNNMTANGSVVYGTDTHLAYVDLEASGSDQYLTVANSAADNNLPSGFTAWVVANLETVGDSTLIAKRFDGTALADHLDTFELSVLSGGEVQLQVWDNSVTVGGTETYIGRKTTTTLSGSTWYLIAGKYLSSAKTSADIEILTYKLSDLTNFADTTDVQNNQASFVNAEDVASNVTIGRRDGDTPAAYYDGKIMGGISEDIILDSNIKNMAYVYKTLLGL